MDLQKLNTNFYPLLQRGAHILQEISRVSVNVFFFANPEFDFNACRLDDDMGVVDTTYSTTVTTATQ